MRPPVVLSLTYSLFAPLLFAADSGALATVPDRVTAVAIIHEMNLARQNSTLYATFVEQTRQNYSGHVCLLPGNLRLCTHEGVRALDEAIQFLRRAKPQPPLALSPGLCLAAADHCREQAGGATGHYGSDGGDPGNRINRYGVVSQGWAENIAYGHHTAREIVLALIVDDGVRRRGHRKNIFNPTYDVVGAAYGPHARFGSVCSIDFASGYAENKLARSGSDAQNSF
ncbi:MAG: CAP domain-containing protein [Verrucomicrobia bacterium]|nr:MAG: CAP domain-containing protein [Verrucomicrobiota bacterium]